MRAKAIMCSARELSSSHTRGRKSNGARVQWRMEPAREADKFTLRFINGSPFGKQREVTESTGLLRVTQPAIFKYEMDLIDTKTGTKYSIPHCPVFQSDE
jgi:hypothetical protein